MVANVKVTIDGLDQLNENLAGRIPKKIGLGIGKVARGLHSVLEAAIIDRYHVPVNIGGLNSVLEQRSISTVKFGKNFIRSGLEYRFKAIALSKFPVKEVRVSAKSRFAQARPNGGFRYIKKDYALAAQVKVLRRRGYTTVTGKRGYGGFLIKPTRAKSGNAQHRGVYERQQGATWLQEPFIRAPIKPLFGPSLSQMAGTVIETDPKVRKYLDNAADIIIQELRK